ncbi:MAG: substrate-binding domain-containing protein, partial [Propionivibrio sp.]
LTGGGSAGLGKALLATGRAGAVRVVTHDLVSDTVHLIEKGVFDFTIGQDPVAQGYLPLKILYAYLQDGVLPGDSFIRISIDIRTLGNLGRNGREAG